MHDSHTQALHQAIERKDWPAALAAARALQLADPKDAQHCLTMAALHRVQADLAGEEAALEQALAIDPYHVPALLFKGKLRERQGRRADAARAYGMALVAAEGQGLEQSEFGIALAHARRFRGEYERQFEHHVDAGLERVYARHGGAVTDRFKASIDLMLGRKRRYDSQPLRFFFPQLPAIEFYDRQHFPWLEQVESQWETIRDEYLAARAGSREQFQPYVQYESSDPVGQWATLNRSQDWTVYSLWEYGRAVPEAIARCPVTARILESLPQPVQAGRTPVVQFSLLRPGVHIPPHTGASNARLLCHLPLVIPPDCAFRVGNSTRIWEPGKAWVFDDTIEHEAWNRSQEERAILIFDVWNPFLSESERELLRELGVVLEGFSGADTGYGA